jgi:hypothetical protein
MNNTGFKGIINYLNKDIEYIVKFDLIDQKKYRVNIENKKYLQMKDFNDYKDIPLITDIIVNNISIFNLNRNSKERMEERMIHYKRDIDFIFNAYHLDKEMYKKEILLLQKREFDIIFTDFLSNLDNYVSYDFPLNKKILFTGYNTNKINEVLKEGIFIFQSDLFNIDIQQKGQFTLNSNFNEILHYFQKDNIEKTLKKEALKLIFEIFKDIYLLKNVNLFLDDMYNCSTLFKEKNLSFDNYIEKYYLQKQLANF